MKAVRFELVVLLVLAVLFSNCILQCKIPEIPKMHLKKYNEDEIHTEKTDQIDCMC